MKKRISILAFSLLTVGILSAVIPFGFFKYTAPTTDSGAPNDNFESYTDGVSANGLNGGVGWNGAYIDASGPLGVQTSDTMESYTDGSSLSNLNSGIGWNGPYISD